MDYLDPNKKRKHRIRIMIGYGLFSIAIAMATLLLVYIANGYYIDRNTGEVIQNGLVFVDSVPSGADVDINGERQNNKTDIRLVIPSGTYKIDVTKSGYQPWSRTLLLEGGSLRRLTYARLFPETITATPTLDIPGSITDSSQSIDKRWLAISNPESPLTINIIDTEQVAPVLQQLVLPATLVSTLESGKLEFVEWSQDDVHILAKYTSVDGVSYLLIDRTNPELTVNLSTSLKAPTNAEISLKDRKRDQFFVYQQKEKALFSADLVNGVETTPIIDKKVISYKVFGTDWVLYITDSETQGKVEARFLRGNKDILLKELSVDDEYYLELAKLGNAPVMAVSSPIENRAIVYNDPQNYLNENPEAKIPVATTVLRINQPVGLTISSDSSVVLGYGVDNLASHEFEADRSYNYKVDVGIDLDHEPQWMDGQHLVYSSKGKQYVVDFDGSNTVELVPSLAHVGSYYSDNIDLMYAFSPAVEETTETSAKPIQLTVTNLLIESDR